MVCLCRGVPSAVKEWGGHGKCPIPGETLEKSSHAICVRRSYHLYT